MTITLNYALIAAINVLRDSAESGRMPSGEPLDAAAVRVHADAADALQAHAADTASAIELLRKIIPPSPLAWWLEGSSMRDTMMQSVRLVALADGLK